MLGIRFKRFQKGGAFYSVVRNASFLLSSNILGGILSLVALTCAGHGLASAEFGTLVVIQAYTKMVSDIAKFQTWQLIVRFGTPALTQGDTERFKDVTNLSFGLDLSSGLLAMIAGMLCLPLLGHAVGISRENFWLALVFCTLIPFITSATSTGILRSLDRFDLIAIQQSIKPGLQAIGSVIAYFGGLGFPGFIITWYLTGLVGNLFLWWAALHELKRQNIKGALTPSIFKAARRIKASWDFVWTTNLAHSIYSIRNAGSNVIVGVVLGPSAAGLFKIATSFFEATGTPSDLLAKSLYPEMMRMNPNENKPWKLALRSAFMALGLGILMIILVSLVGEPLISLVFGAKYLEAYSLLKVMLWAVVISMASFPLESLLYMAHRQRAALIAEGSATLVYVLLLLLFMQLYGVMGAAWGFFAGQCINAIFMLIPTISAYKKRHTLVHE